MAKKEPNKPDDVKTAPANETPAEEKAAPAAPLEAGGEALPPEMTAEEAATLAQEGAAALRDIDEEQFEPPATFDIPAPGDVVVSFDKINEIISEKKAAKAQEAEQPAPEPPAPEEKAPEPAKQARRGRPPKADKADKPDKAPKPEKSAKAPKAAAEKQAPAPEPEQPPEPREAPRSNEQEQIVYLNLSELFPFKDHPFQVRKDEEMAAMVESVKDKGVTQRTMPPGPPRRKARRKMRNGNMVTSGQVGPKLIFTGKEGANVQ